MTNPFDIFRQPKNTMPEIKEIWGFVSVDPNDGNEGLCAAPLQGMTLPMIAADPKRLAQLRPIAQQMANAFGMNIKLVKFSVREELEMYVPQEKSNAV